MTNGGSKQNSLRSTEFGKIKKDTTIQGYFLDSLTETSRDYFENVILSENADSVVFFYSTENINYY